MRNFRELEVWKDARKLVKEVYLLTKTLPDTEKYGLVSQINRCVISIPANIVEGSAYELESHLILCNDLELISDVEASATISRIQILQKKVASLIKYNNSKQ